MASTIPLNTTISAGGERRRLYLLKILMANPNFLILDEPTNDLDIYTLQILEQFLRGYKGCLVIVSHDRSFMDHIVDHLFVFEEGGVIHDYHSNYTDYMLERERRRKAENAVKREEKPQYERPKPTKRKATYKEQKEYESLTAEIETLSKEKQQLEATLAGSTDQAAVIEASQVYQPWTLLFPLCGMAAFIWDGIYIGATATKGMLISMASGMVVFFALYVLLVPLWGNHGLWVAFVVYLATRGIAQTLMRQKIWKK